MRVIVYQASDTSALSKNFTRKDFKCPCGCTRQMVDSELVEKLQAIRDKLGKAIKVTSGYRCITHNASKTVGGSPNSKHRYGMAADWRMVNRSINPVALGIIAAQYFKAVGIYWYDAAPSYTPIPAMQRQRGCAMPRGTTPAPPTRSSFCRPSAGVAPGMQTVQPRRCSSGCWD